VSTSFAIFIITIADIITITSIITIPGIITITITITSIITIISFTTYECKEILLQVPSNRASSRTEGPPATELLVIKIKTNKRISTKCGSR
jgi:hypothetical protein